MKKITFIGFLIFIGCYTFSQPIAVKLTHHVIIDTDCAIDDFRAISLLLARPEIKVDAILISDGSLPPSDGILKVRSLLEVFGRSDIPVATGKEMKSSGPPWRKFNSTISWGPKTVSGTDKSQDAKTCLAGILEKSKEPVVLLCMGPLSNIAEFLRDYKELQPEIERILWYNESLDPLTGFNADFDPSAVQFVMNAGIRMDIVSNLNKGNAVFDTALANLCESEPTKTARALHFGYSQPAVLQKLNENHFRLYDDLVVIYLTNPELFDMNILKDRVKIRYNRDYDVESVREAIGDMIKGTYVIQDQIVFSRFPDKKEMFRYDIRRIMDSVISKYGYDEWKANVMTDEFHGHLGVFSIVGAKMGMRAREIFGVGPDVLKVITDAGIRPPYSCLNDGIQVSTGSTLGMGLISLSNDKLSRPSAVFTHQNRSVRLTLKKEYLDMVNNDIQEGIVKYGLMDDGYWKLVRRNAIKYWLEWDRNVIFEVEHLINPEIPSPKKIFPATIPTE